MVYVATVAAELVLPDLESGGQAAVSFGRPVDERACQVKGVFVARGTRGTTRRRASPRSGRASRPTWSRSASPARPTPRGSPGPAWRSACGSRRSSSRRPGPEPGDRSRERDARVARHLLPGAAAGAAVHRLGGRGPERRLPEPRRVRRRGARRALVPVLQQEQAQRRGEPARAGARHRPGHRPGLAAAAALRALGDLGRALRAHGAAHRGDRVVLRAQGHLQAARGRRVPGALGRAGAARSGAAARRRSAATAPTPCSRCGRSRTWRSASTARTRSRRSWTRSSAASRTASASGSR